MAMIKHNYPRSEHQGPVLIGSQFASEPALRPANQSNNQQMLANVLRGGSNIMQRDLSNISLTQEEELQVRMLMQQGMSREQAIQSLPRIQYGRQ